MWKSVYLITYSQADRKIVPKKETFVNIIKVAFNKSSKIAFTSYCCQEKHKDGQQHYDMAIKLKNQRRWLSAGNFIDKTNDVKVNFSEKHSNYSEDHPNLISAPRPTAVSIS